MKFLFLFFLLHMYIQVRLGAVKGLLTFAENDIFSKTISRISLALKMEIINLALRNWVQNFVLN